jgi:hypothetical protein
MQRWYHKGSLFGFLNPLFGMLLLQDVAHDAVIAADGHTYERHAIEQWLRLPHSFSTSPVTGHRMQCQLRSNFVYTSLVCSLIMAFQ